MIDTTAILHTMKQADSAWWCLTARAKPVAKAASTHCILEAWLILSSLNVVLTGNPLQSNWGSASSNISQIKQISDSSEKRYVYQIVNLFLNLCLDAHSRLLQGLRFQAATATINKLSDILRYLSYYFLIKCFLLLFPTVEAQDSIHIRSPIEAMRGLQRLIVQAGPCDPEESATKQHMFRPRTESTPEGGGP